LKNQTPKIGFLPLFGIKLLLDFVDFFATKEVEASFLAKNGLLKPIGTIHL